MEPQLLVQCPCGCSAYYDEHGPVEWYIERCEHHDSADDLIRQRDALVEACEALLEADKELSPGNFERAAATALRLARTALALVREGAR